MSLTLLWIEEGQSRMEPRIDPQHNCIPSMQRVSNLEEKTHANNGDTKQKIQQWLS